MPKGWAFCYEPGTPIMRRGAAGTNGLSPVMGVNQLYVTEMCSGSKEGSYLRHIDLCTTQL